MCRYVYTVTWLGKLDLILTMNTQESIQCYNFNQKEAPGGTSMGAKILNFEESEFGMVIFL